MFLIVTVCSACFGIKPTLCKLSIRMVLDVNTNIRLLGCIYGISKVSTPEVSVNIFIYIHFSQPYSHFHIYTMP